ncbi:MAG: patatin-like phospholipase family protein [Deltaproteobacteria bacterium]|jgi:NTE family protein|nr:patatin-like phospholipase family protein [Deltaproteobacteria bacterium]
MSKSIRLVLGSGGARGLAHIGAIREIEKRGYRINSVIGCSVGAIVGGYYCAGKLDKFEEWVCSLSEWDVVRFMDFSLFSKNGIMKGDLLTDTMRELVGDQSIEDLPIPFAAVATNLIDHKEVWLNRGDLFDAIRASMAIPGLMTPKEIDGKTLVDGGLLNPLPGAPTYLDGTQFTIAISLAGRDVDQPFGPNPPEPNESSIGRYRKSIDEFLGSVHDRLGIEAKKEPKKEKVELGVSGVMLEAFDAMQQTIARYRLAAYPPDILIEIPNNVCRTLEVYKARQLIHAGEHWARETFQHHAHLAGT